MLRIAFLFFLQLFRKGANVAETGRAGICTEPSPAPGSDRWMQQTPQASSGESHDTNRQRTSFSSTCLFHVPLEERRQDSSFNNQQDLVNSICESFQAGKNIPRWNIHVCYKNTDFFVLLRLNWSCSPAVELFGCWCCRFCGAWKGMVIKNQTYSPHLSCSCIKTSFGNLHSKPVIRPIITS